MARNENHAGKSNKAKQVRYPRGHAALREGLPQGLALGGAVRRGEYFSGPEAVDDDGPTLCSNYNDDCLILLALVPAASAEIIIEESLIDYSDTSHAPSYALTGYPVAELASAKAFGVQKYRKSGNF